MATQDPITPEQRAGFQEVRRLMRRHGETNWGMPDDIAITLAQELADVPPDQVLERAKGILKGLKETNLKEKEKRAKARERVAELKERPLTNLGQPGLIGYLKRSIVASINATPLIALNFMEVNDKGLQVYTPLAPISQRTFKWRDLTANRIVLSVNPPAYFDWLFGLLRQLRINLSTPWGGITVYEPGSGRTLAEAVALWPDRRIAEFRLALQQVHLVENPFEGYRRLPRLVDLLGYHLEEWDLRLTEDQRQQMLRQAQVDEDEDEDEE
jgi:hypothetical protein